MLSKVEELIDHVNNSWDLAALAANFVAPDVHAIAKTPIGNWGEDCWAWEVERNGNFSVRSAYKILSTSMRHSYEPSSSGAAGNALWNKLWKISVPPRVRDFWWRVIRGFVPCNSVLLTRHIEKAPFCDLCGKEETITHALFDCTWARLFWKEMKTMMQIKIPVLHPHSWASDLIEGKLGSDQFVCIILCGC